MKGATLLVVLLVLGAGAAVVWFLTRPAPVPPPDPLAAGVAGAVGAVSAGLGGALSIVDKGLGGVESVAIGLPVRILNDGVSLAEAPFKALGKLLHL